MPRGERTVRDLLGWLDRHAGDDALITLTWGTEDWVGSPEEARARLAREPLDSGAPEATIKHPMRPVPRLATEQDRRILDAWLGRR